MNFQQRDLAYVWHPCSQMKDYLSFPAIDLAGAAGPYLIKRNGQKIIDAISSWWCKNLGHGHPRLRQALLAQAQQFEHVMLGQVSFDKIIDLSERLSQLTGLDKVFYASDGSCAIDIALKMSLHAHHIQGESQRTRFMALQNDYHGETGLSLAVSDLALYRKAYDPVLPQVEFLQNIPYVNTSADPLWQNCETHWRSIEIQLEKHKDHLSAIIIEPLLQGAGGMRVYSQDLLKRLRQWTQANNIHLIADEIMTGLGRTGKATAYQHAGITPDLVCLGKGLTAGWLPISTTIVSNKIYDLFFDDYETGKSFLHSHTYSGNALAVAVALECLDVLEQENIYQQVQHNQHYLYENMLGVAKATGCLENVRQFGWMAAADLITDKPRAGFAVFQQAVKLGALLRPLGNTLYWMPPLNTSHDVLDDLRDITVAAISKTL